MRPSEGSGRRYVHGGAPLAALLLITGCMASEPRADHGSPRPADASPVEAAQSASPSLPASRRLEFEAEPHAPEEKPPSAPPVPASGADEGWEFQVAPYLWLAGIQGTVQVGPIGIPVQQSFSDLAENLDFGGSLRAEARSGSFSLMLDTTYIDLAAETEVPSGTASVDLKTFFLELDLGYSPKSAPGLCFFLGARVADIEQKVNVPGLDIADRCGTVVDPVIGARGSWNLGEKFLFWARGDIGGFGVSSEFTSQLAGTFRWAFSRVGGVELGYRMYTYNVQNSKLSLDARISGPTLGLDFRF
jgi:hypothetical protein